MGTWVVAAAVWIGTGLVTGLWMARRGHDWRWTVIALVLGPLFVPIALERVERVPRVALHGDDGEPGPRAQTTGPRLLVGIDGSDEATDSLRTSLALVGGHCGLVVLAEVVSFDDADAEADADTDTDADPHVEQAQQHLREAASLVVTAPVNREVLAGPPGEALRRYAADHEIDVVVVGRRGRGMSERLLGSVSEHLVRHSEVPVLVVEPRTRGTADAG